MSRRTGDVLALVVGTTVVRLGMSGAHRWYVRDRMGPWLVAAGLLLAVLALARLFLRSAAGAASDLEAIDTERRPRAHAHDGVPRIALALLVPVMLVYLVAPRPLGSYAASRVGSVRPTSVAPAALPPLPDPSGGAVDLTLLDVVRRAAVDGGSSLDGRRLRLRGFVVPTGDTPDGFLLTRFRIACCAADALAVQVLVRGLDQLGAGVPRRDTWVTIEGDLVVPDPVVPTVLARSLTVDPVPRDPYED